MTSIGAPDDDPAAGACPEEPRRVADRDRPAAPIADRNPARRERRAAEDPSGRFPLPFLAWPDASTTAAHQRRAARRRRGATFTTFDPAHGGELATVAKGGGDDVDAAVTAARGAFDGAWAKTSPAKRARALNRLAQLLDEQTDALAELESRNNGKAKWQCAAEIKVAVARSSSSPGRRSTSTAARTS